MVSGISMTVIAINVTPRGISVLRDKRGKPERDPNEREPSGSAAGLPFVIGGYFRLRGFAHFRWGRRDRVLHPFLGFLPRHPALPRGAVGISAVRIARAAG